MSRDTAHVDVESTRLADAHLPEGRRVWEAAVLRVDAAGQALDSVWLQITDVDLTHADDVALRIGRFDERFHPDQYGELGPARWMRGAGTPTRLAGVTERQAALMIAAITDGAVIASSNPAFDMGSFADMLRRNGVAGEDLPWYHHPHDIPVHAKGWLAARSQLGAGPMAPDGTHWAAASYSTRVISEAVGIPEPADRHGALADVAWLRDVDDVVLGRTAPSARLNATPPATIAG